ncbi:MAG: site-2 protease family protein [Phycisphaerales bacterium]|nr:site-2 protease family protein [Phycisphaerales bacterium]
MDPIRDEIILAPSPPFEWQRPPKFQNRLWIHLLLLALTIGNTALVGGWAYSVTILAILGCHEFGHYLTCRYYDVDASLPYFLPMPVSITGTLGAFIRIREPIPSKRMLFDIGIAGPIAGFIVAVPALLVGVSLSRIVPISDTGVWLGEPLLLKAASYLMWGPIADGYTLEIHQIGFAAWFGLLATALNLFPIGQLDGGHICYAVLGRRSTYVTVVMVGVTLALSYLSTSWIVWTIMLVAMLVMFGPRHPRTFDEEEPLDRTRLILAVLAAVMFALCFTPAPIEILINS